MATSEPKTLKLLEQSITLVDNSEVKPRWDMDWTQTVSATSNSSTINFKLYKRGAEESTSTHFATELYLTIKNQNGKVVKTVDISRIKHTSQAASFNDKLHNSYSFTIDHNSDGSAYFQVTVTGSIYYGTNKTTTLDPVVLEKTYTQCTPPTAFSFDRAIYAPGDKITLTWSGAGTGGSNTIESYDVYLLSTSDSSNRVGTATNQYTHYGSVNHNSASTNQSFAFTLGSGNRGNILKAAIITKGKGGNGFNSQLFEFSNTAKINSLPGKPLVSGTTILPYGDGGSCSLQVTGGADADSGTAAWYVVKDEEGKVVQEKTSTSNRCVIEKEGTYYFYSHDGVELGEAAQEVVILRATDAPITVPQVVYTSHKVDPEAGVAQAVSFTVNCSDAGGLPGGIRYLAIYVGASKEDLEDNIEKGSIFYKSSTSGTTFSVGDIRELPNSNILDLKQGAYYQIATYRDDGGGSVGEKTLCPTLFYTPPVNELFMGIYNNIQLENGGEIFDDTLYFKVQKGATLFSKAILDIKGVKSQIDLQILEQNDYDILSARIDGQWINEGSKTIAFWSRNGAKELYSLDVSKWQKAAWFEPLKCTIELGGAAINALQFGESAPSSGYRLKLIEWQTHLNGTELGAYGFSSGSKIYLKATRPVTYQVEIGTLADLDNEDNTDAYIDCSWQKYREIFAVALQDRTLLGRDEKFQFQIVIEKFNGTKLFGTETFEQNISFKEAPKIIDSFDGKNYGLFSSRGESLEYFACPEAGETDERVFLGEPIYLRALVQCYDYKFLSSASAKLLIKIKNQSEIEETIENIPCQAQLMEESQFTYSAQEQKPISLIITPVKDIILNKQINDILIFYLVLDGAEQELEVKAKNREENNNKIYYCGRNEVILRGAKITYDNSEITVSTSNCEFVYPKDPSLDSVLDEKYVHPGVFVEWRTDDETYPLIEDAAADLADLPPYVKRIYSRNMNGGNIGDRLINLNKTEPLPGLFSEDTKKLWFRLHYTQQLYHKPVQAVNEENDFWRTDAYSEEFVIYDSMPTVGYRPNQVLINRSHADNEDAALVVGPTGENKAIYLLSNIDKSYIKIDLADGTIDGVIVDCGSWT